MSPQTRPDTYEYLHKLWYWPACISTVQEAHTPLKRLPSELTFRFLSLLDESINFCLIFLLQINTVPGLTDHPGFDRGVCRYPVYLIIWKWTLLKMRFKLLADQVTPGWIPATFAWALHSTVLGRRPILFPILGQLTRTETQGDICCMDCDHRRQILSDTTDIIKEMFARALQG